LIKLHWIIGGDFNIITSLAEKKGGIPRLDMEADLFKETIYNLHLVDWETENGIFTWNNCRRGVHKISSRLDRFLLFESLITQNLSIEAIILPCHGSDHWPICLDLDIQSAPINRPFRLE
jgi:exonuclease III